MTTACGTEAVIGFLTEIQQGDSYTGSRKMSLRFRDANGNTITGFGDKSPADSDFTWELRLSPAPVVPGVAATLEVSGDEDDWDDSDSLLAVELTTANTASLTWTGGNPVREFAWNLVLAWSGYQYIFHGTTRVRSTISDPA